MPATCAAGVHAEREAKTSRRPPAAGCAGPHPGQRSAFPCLRATCASHAERGSGGSGSFPSARLRRAVPAGQRSAFPCLRATCAAGVHAERGAIPSGSSRRTNFCAVGRHELLRTDEVRGEGKYGVFGRGEFREWARFGSGRRGGGSGATGASRPRSETRLGCIPLMPHASPERHRVSVIPVVQARSTPRPPRTSGQNMLVRVRIIAFRHTSRKRRSRLLSVSGRNPRRTELSAAAGGEAADSLVRNEHGVPGLHPKAHSRRPPPELASPVPPPSPGPPAQSKQSSVFPGTPLIRSPSRLGTAPSEPHRRQRGGKLRRPNALPPRPEHPTRPQARPGSRITAATDPAPPGSPVPSSPTQLAPAPQGRRAHHPGPSKPPRCASFSDSGPASGAPRLCRAPPGRDCPEVGCNT